MAKAKRGAVVLDVEFTAWEGSMDRQWSDRGEYKEVVQIGAVKVDPVSLAPIEEFEILVRPRVNPVLSAYLVDLTGISNERLSLEGVDFITAYRAFLTFVGDARVAAWGRDDSIFKDNLLLCGWAGLLPIPPYTDVTPIYRAQGIDTTGKRACDAAPLAGVPFEGHAHDGLADARGVARGLKALVERGAPNPFLDAAPGAQG